MKLKILTLTALCAVLSFGTALADEPGGCRWIGGDTPTGSTVKREFDVFSPDTLDLQRVPIGSPMATWNAGISNRGSVVCNPWEVPIVRVRYLVEGRALADGFTNVFETGLTGVGVRISAGRNTLPWEFSYNNASNQLSLPTNLRIEFIRLSRDVATGNVLMNFKILLHVHTWNPAEIRIEGNTDLQSQSYFSGCAGVEKLNIPMGRLPIANLGGSQRKTFNLDVLCSGMAAGTKVPVKVYFEGSSDGPGRLNLEPGGAEGVEISLASDRGVSLPFSQGNALDMTWTRSEPTGELYRLPVVAEYVKKTSQKVEPGRANATLNYILEYN